MLINRYKSLYHHFSKKFVDRLITRNVIAGYNSLFVSEWKNLDRLKEYGAKDQYKNACNEFERRWYISHPTGNHVAGKLPSYHAKLSFASQDEGKIEIEIDLSSPTTRIIEDVIDIVTAWKSEFKETKEFWYKNHKKFQHESFADIEKQRRLHGNVKEDLEYYDLIMEVYAAKEDGNSWQKIADHFQLNSLDTARNHYEAAQLLIKKGLPGFPPFPEG